MKKGIALFVLLFVTSVICGQDLQPLKEGEKTGLYSPAKGWVIPARYDSITPIEFPRYKGDSTYYTDLWVLKKGRTGSPDYRFQLATRDGKLLSSQSFKAFDTDYDSPGYTDTNRYFQLIGEQSLTTVSVSLLLKELPYTGLKRHFLDYFIATKPDGKQCLLDAKMKELDCFERMKETETSFMTFYGQENQDSLYELTMVDYYSDYVQVSSTVDGKLKSALYSLEKQAVVTPFMENPVFHIRFINDIQAYTYQLKGQHEVGFYLPAMAMGTQPIYMQVQLLPDGRAIVNTRENPKAQLLEIRNRFPAVVLEDDVIFPSNALSMQYKSEGNTQSPFMSPIYVPLICTQNMEGKIGFYCENGTRIPDLYDSIGGHVGLENVIDVCAAGKYGMANRSTGKIIAPFSAQPFKPELYDYSGEYFVRLDDCFLDYKGKFYGFPIESNFMIYKRNGKMGVWYTSQFSTDTIYLVPPVYKKITEFDNSEGRYLYGVTNESGKMGMLNYRGDTVVPFDFSKLEKDEFEGLSFVRAFSGKKQGMITFCNGVTVPAIYDQWSGKTDASQQYFAIETQIGDKKGLYSFDGKELLPCVYDHISFQLTDESNQQYKAVEALLQGKWNVQPVFVKDMSHYLCDNANYFPAIDRTQFQQYDLVINTIGLVLENGTYTQQNYLSPPETATKGIAEKDVVVSDEGLDFFIENGKIGVKDSSGNVLVKPRFTNVHCQDSQTIMVSDATGDYYVNVYSNKHYKMQQ